MNKSIIYVKCENFSVLIIEIYKLLIDKKEFVINNTKFKWLSMEELENDPEIMQINGDIIGFIKEWFTK